MYNQSTHETSNPFHSTYTRTPTSRTSTRTTFPPTAPEQLLPPETTPRTPDTTPGDVPQTISVKEFKVTGSTVFSQKEFAEVLKDYINRPITLAELFQARAAITELYVKKVI